MALPGPRRPFSLPYWALKYVPFDRAAPLADSTRAVLSHYDPFLVFPERCLPADSLLPGHNPADDAR